MYNLVLNQRFINLWELMRCLITPSLILKVDTTRDASVTKRMCLLTAWLWQGCLNLIGSVAMY